MGLFRPPLADEKIARALLTPLFNYKSLRDFFSKKVRAKDKISPLLEAHDCRVLFVCSKCDLVLLPLQKITY